ncbi:MAG: glycosyltransferase family 2 protein [Planctomycetota bacterium]|jgi:glycosyltransferase involved in cell wall biosynthesis
MPDNREKTGISIVIPVHNEEGSLHDLASRIIEVLDEKKHDFEIIFVDDGSTDESPNILKKFASSETRIRIVELTRNFGQSSALDAGFRAARGEIVIPMDADGQNEPADIPRLLMKLEDGFDLVSGYRKHRRDPYYRKVLPSRVANLLIRLFTGVRLKDFGCTLKAYRSWVLEDVRLYGEMHRFLPVFAHWNGGRIAELDVEHHPRKHGRSHYSLNRVFKVIVDLITVTFMTNFASKPGYFFGCVGFFSMLAGIGFAGWALYEKLGPQKVFVHKNPRALLAVFLFIVGVIVVLMGLVAEMLVRLREESRHTSSYKIRSRTNFPEE